MGFLNKPYIEVFNDLFSTIIDKYRLEVVEIDDTEIKLCSENYELIVFINMDGAFLRYYNLNTNDCYDISNYLALNTESVDREGLSNSEVISVEVYESLVVRERVLERKFSNLLEGKLDWFENYKESKYFWKLPTSKK